jgi:hypothetical protein
MSVPFASSSIPWQLPGFKSRAGPFEAPLNQGIPNNHAPMSSAYTAAPAADIEEWELCGFKDSGLKEINDWCAQRVAPGIKFVLFAYGTAVFITEDMVKDLDGKDASYVPLLPEVPAARCRGSHTEYVANQRKYVAAKSKTLSERDLLLYRAAVRYLAEVGYPVAGMEDSCRLMHLRDNAMWTSQYRFHKHAIAYMPKSLGITSAQLANATVKDMGLRLDQLTLVPAFIHSEGSYDTADRSIDPKTWENPHRAGIYDNPETTGLRVFTASPDPSSVIAAMFR